MRVNATARVRLLVSGRVQGVGFRYSAAHEARRLGLLGWVRNTPDGRVEIVAEGASEAVSELIDWCGIGPPAARVDKVERTDLVGGQPLSAFTVR